MPPPTIGHLRAPTAPLRHDCQLHLPHGHAHLPPCSPSRLTLYTHNAPHHALLIYTPYHLYAGAFVTAGVWLRPGVLLMVMREVASAFMCWRRSISGDVSMSRCLLHMLHREHVVGTLGSRLGRRQWRSELRCVAAVYGRARACVVIVRVRP